jgi:cysteine desulfurase
MIYLDHASTTPTDPRVIKCMTPFFNSNFGNPSSLYKIGREAARTVSQSRTSISKILNCAPEELIFTAGGTESDNLAIFGVANSFIENAKDYHLITSSIEHSAVLETFKVLEKKGFQVTYLPVDKFGLINPDDLSKALRPNTILVSIMYANNEIGTIQNIAEFSKIIKNYRRIQQVDKSDNPIYPIFHTDACQAAGYLNLDTDKLGVDLLTINGSKIYGPKQIGALYKRKAIKLEPIFYGGDQEAGLRPGTENVSAIIGFAEALKLVDSNRTKESKRLEKLRDFFIMELLKLPETILNGHPIERLPNNINVTFRRIEGESIMLKLDREGIYVSTGSACHSVSLEPSHVILAIGQEAGDAHGSMRFTMGKSTTKAHLGKVLKILPSIIEDLRKLTAVNR